MRSDFLFLKSFRVNFPVEVKKEFYWEALKQTGELHQDKPDWKKIMETADKLWVVLSSLDNPGLSFYTESIAKEEDKKSFINLILDEKRARLNLAPTDKEAYIKEMKRIIKERRKFFEMMLEITDEDIKDFRKGKWKWWLIGGVAATTAVVMGCWGIKKVTENKNKKE